MSKQKAVIGIGNPLRGDDGIGIHILHELEKRKTSSDFSLLDGGTGGIRLLHLLKNLDEVYIIDAVDFDGEPGEFVFFQPNQIKSKQVSKGPHDTNIFDILTLAVKLSGKPQKTVIMGIQPKTTDIKQGLSEELKNRLKLMVEALLNEMDNL
jgi:hydrogenase maturation protease